MAYLRMIEDDEILTYLTELDVIADCEKAWKSELVEVNKNIREWASSPEMVEFGKTSRLRFLKDEIKRYKNDKKEKIDMMCSLVGTNGACLISLVEGQVEKLEWKIQRLLMEKRSLEGKTKEGDITPAMIEQAKEFPVSSLIEVDGRCKAKCINHDDSHPSMDCRNNFVYCYSCGYSDDAIGVYRKLHGVGFVEAVRALSTV